MRRNAWNQVYAQAQMVFNNVGKRPEKVRMGTLNVGERILKSSGRQM